VWRGRPRPRPLTLWLTWKLILMKEMLNRSDTSSVSIWVLHFARLGFVLAFGWRSGSPLR